MIRDLLFDLSNTFGGMRLYRNRAMRSQWSGTFPDGTYVVVTRCSPDDGKRWEVEATNRRRRTTLRYFASRVQAKCWLVALWKQERHAVRTRIRLRAYHEERVRSL